MHTNLFPVVPAQAGTHNTVPLESWLWIPAFAGMTWKVFWFAASLAATFASPSISHAQTSTYPQRPIRLIVGFTPGGSTDLVGRMLGARLSERLGQQVVIDNRPGASGIIAAELVSKAQPTATPC
jgi:tripartite-type tricarboxylate transporter receptor subunit TctC